MTQALVGDTSDNYPGLKGFGPVKAEKVAWLNTTLPAMWDAWLRRTARTGAPLLMRCSMPAWPDPATRGL
jgi:hypothetical protein